MTLLDAVFKKRYDKFKQGDLDKDQGVYVLVDVNGEVLDVVSTATAAMWAEELKGTAK